MDVAIHFTVALIKAIGLLFHFIVKKRYLPYPFLALFLNYWKFLRTQSQ